MDIEPDSIKQTGMEDGPQLYVEAAIEDGENLWKVKNEMEQMRKDHQKKIQDMQKTIDAKHVEAAIEDGENLWKVKNEMEQMRKDHQKKIQDMQKTIDAKHVELQKKEADLSRRAQELDIINDELNKATYKCQKLEGREQISASLPEKSMNFSKVLHMDNMTKQVKRPIKVEFDFIPRIIYPLKGPQALITFELEQVAQNVLAEKCHSVSFDTFQMKITAQSLLLEAIQQFKISTDVSRQQIVVSEIPDTLQEDQMMDKLELHFYKRKNGGGEVEKVDYNKKEGTAMITFVKDGAADTAVQEKKHRIQIGNEEICVKVSPFLQGQLKDFKTFTAVSRRTVLLTGFNDVLSQDEMQDRLEIHFQKPSNGGGEVENIIYVPQDKCAWVEFTYKSVKLSDEDE